MDQKQIRTSKGQRIVIGIIAMLLLFSTLAIYALIVLTGNSDSSTNNPSLAEAEAKITDAQNTRQILANDLSNKYFDELLGYKKEYVKSYNSATVNNTGLTSRDIKQGSGAELKDGTDYYAYYIGFCSDESIFDSSFDSSDSPSKLSLPLYDSADGSLIAGWSEGVIGMKVGGVRELSIPGELAYGDTREICGGYNSPLKFIIMVIDPSDEYKTAQLAYDKAYAEYISAYYASSASSSDSDASDDSDEGSDEDSDEESDEESSDGAEAGAAAGTGVSE